MGIAVSDQLSAVSFFDARVAGKKKAATKVAAGLIELNAEC
jgi:hypothetical protein